MKIEFDEAKRQKTLTMRHLDMARCGEVFADIHLTIPDTHKDYGEERYITVGFMDARMVVIVWTPRKSIRRIISIRKANEREQARFNFN